MCDLEPGERRKRRPWKRIDEAEVLFLFRSRHAHESDRVAREWRHGLRHEGLDFVRPAVLERPSAPSSPELAALHVDGAVLGCLA